MPAVQCRAPWVPSDNWSTSFRDGQLVREGYSLSRGLPPGLGPREVCRGCLICGGDCSWQQRSSCVFAGHGGLIPGLPMPNKCFPMSKRNLDDF